MARISASAPIAGLEMPGETIESVVPRKLDLPMLAASAAIDPATLEQRIRILLNAIISDVPQPPDDWETLLSLQFSGHLNTYFERYLLGVEARSAAANLAIAALKTVKLGDVDTANSLYVKARQSLYEANVLFADAAQNSIEAIDQVDAVLEEIRQRSFDIAGVLCLKNEACSLAIDALDAGSEYAVTYSKDGKDAADKKLMATLIAKAVLKVKVGDFQLEKFIDDRVDHITGKAAAPFYSGILKVLNDPQTAKTALQLLASSNRQTAQSKVEDAIKGMVEYFQEQSGNPGVNVPPPTPQNVYVQVDPVTLTVERRRTATYRVSLIRKNFAGAFPLRVMVKAVTDQSNWDPTRDVPPIGMNVSFNPPAPAGSESSVMTVTISSAFPISSYRLLVYGVTVNVSAYGFYTKLQITQAPTPTAAFTFTGGGRTNVSGQSTSYTVAASGTVAFSFAGTTNQTGTSSLWQINNTTVSTAASFNYTLGKGTHNISYKVTNSGGQSATATAVVVITELVLPTAAFTFTGGGRTNTSGQSTSYTVAAGGSVAFSFAGTTNQTGTSSLWQINSATVSTAASFNYTLGKGTHNISYKVTNSGGQSATATAVVVIR